MTNAPVKEAPIRVAIVEDDEEVRTSLGHWIGASRALHLVGSYGDGESALADIPRCKPDVVLMDINLQGVDGIECVRRLKAEMPQVHFLMLTVYEDNNRLFKSLMVGASGYLLKRTPPEKLLAAISEVYSGGAPMTPEMARRVVQHFQQSPQPPSDFPRLTPREKDVLELLTKGALYKEIEDTLQMSAGTLRGHITNVYEKLRVHSRTEAVVKYLNR